MKKAGDPSRHGNVPDGATQEKAQAQAPAKEKPSSRKLNEGGRTNDSRGDGNPPGSEEGLPTNVGTPGASR